jgi:hypothetical protein
MRLKLPRTVTAPTQCADLEAGSSQYFSKASATGLATGTTWTWKAKIKPESYAAMTIAAVDDGTNRMEIRLNSSGQIVIAGGTAAAEDLVTSYQSVTLGKVQDISGSITIGTPTGEIMIDEKVVPSFVTASAATTMTIGTPTIYIGRNAAGNYFDGLIGHVFLFNAIISAATLITYSGQIGTGSETSLEGYWSLNGVLTDSSSNANTLTGSGGAVATNAYSLFTNPVTGTSITAGTTNHGIITAQTFSTNTTYTVQIPEGETLPTTGGIGTISYSTQKTPYGFPGDISKWQVETILRTQASKTGTPTQGVWYNLSAANTTGGFFLTIPLGVWKTSYQVSFQGNGTTTLLNTTLSTANNTESNIMFTSYTESVGTITSFTTQIYKENPLNLSTATPYYLNASVYSGGNCTVIYYRGEISPAIIRAECTYL